MHPLLKSLSHGDKRMVKGVAVAFELVRKDPSLFSILINGISSDNELIAMRSADAVEKLTVDRPEWLAAFKHDLIDYIPKIEQKEVRWHLCQIIPRLPLRKKEREELINVFQSFLKDQSRIVVTFAMQALADLAGRDKKLKSKVIPIIGDLTKEGSPAIRSRGEKLLKKLV